MSLPFGEAKLRKRDISAVFLFILATDLWKWNLDSTEFTDLGWKDDSVVPSLAVPFTRVASEKY